MFCDRTSEKQVTSQMYIWDAYTSSLVTNDPSADSIYYKFITEDGRDYIIPFFFQKGNEYIFKVTLSKEFLSPFCREIYAKRKEFAPLRVHSFLL